MNLVIDLGNTFAKVGVFENNQLIDIQWNLEYDALLAYTQKIMPERIIVSSVSYSEETLQKTFRHITDEVYLLQYTTPVPLVKLYDTPETLGADRVAAAIGATVVYPNQNCLVIDLGTCITYDLVDADCQFHGGIISPGMRMRFKAMNTFTQRLPLIEPDEAPALIGKSTKTAMQSGVINGLAAEINGLIEQYKNVLTKINVILCGGDATFFANRIKYPNFVVPELVLIGLNRILEHNVKPKKISDSVNSKPSF
ncbi:type III pantothenate kinase [Flectobacillus major]|jgi:type III pantothenate kinase|uniref:type III pantothenate kinase n=1 Tax=Flectobacillus major TaxID=103 RepID=UPI00041C705D|nr:type III pantothenate kinase [Flectobacillus major]